MPNQDITDPNRRALRAPNRTGDARFIMRWGELKNVFLWLSKCEAFWDQKQVALGARLQNAHRGILDFVAHCKRKRFEFENSRHYPFIKEEALFFVIIRT